MAKYFVENYGCQMNSAEIDSLRLQMNSLGHVEVWDSEQADVVLMNTCSVRATADQRVEGRLGYYKGLRDRQHNVSVVLMGCLAQSKGKELQKKFGKTVSIVWGTYNKQNLIPHLEHLGDPFDYLGQADYEFMQAQPQEKYPFKSYISISHGCNNFCTYCIVPYVRGREVHRPSSEILSDVRRLVDQGVVHFELLGQNVNSYRDVEMCFPELLAKVAEIEGVKRVSFLTSHPKDFSKELVDVIATHSNISRSLHLPFQSGSNHILKKMNRKYTIEDYLSKIEMAKTIPDVELTTDIIVGFPGETEEDFNATLSVVREVRYLEAYMYHYNPRPGTAAVKFNNAVAEPVKLERLQRLIALQRGIMMEKLKDKIGETHVVLTESQSKKDAEWLSGRSQNGVMVFLKTSAENIGKFFEVELTAVSGAGMHSVIKNRLD